MMRHTKSKTPGNSFPVTFLQAFYLFIPGLIFLALYYAIIVKIDIGQDMLMQSYENPAPFFWTIVSILSWMLFSWFSSRLISDEYLLRNNRPYHWLFEQTPRLLGYNIAVCLQIAVLNLPVIQSKGWELWMIFAFNNGYYILLHFFFSLEHRPVAKRKFLVAVIALGAAYLVAIPLLFIARMEKVNQGINYYIPGWKRALALIVLFFIFQIIFTGLVIWRRKWLREKAKASVTPAFSKTARTWRRAYDYFAAGMVALYLAILLLHPFADRVGSLAITFLAFGLWVGCICLLRYWSIRLNIHFWPLLFVLAIVYGIILPNPYRVRLLSTEKKSLYDQRPTFDSFFRKWIRQRVTAGLLNDSSTFNVYLVMSDGGASKSGYWVAEVLSKLEDSSGTGDQFSAHLLSLAGASGGSVGNTAFYCLLKAQMENRLVNSMEKESRAFFKCDFLSSSFARFLGPDLFRHLIPVLPMEDRAAMLEEAMEDNPGSPTIGNYFKSSMSRVIDTTGRLPALFINTTNLQSGAPGVVSTIRLDPRISDRLDILKLIDTVHLDPPDTSKHDIRLSTGVVLGARFPYISPAGGIGKKYFVDGGYFDNSGAGITLELLQYIERRMNDSTDTVYRPYRDRLAFKVIYISNGSDKAREHDLNPFINDLAAPMLTVLGTYGMQTNLTNRKLIAFLNYSSLYTAKEPFDTVNLPQSCRNSSIPYPLNWVISEYNLNRIDSNVKCVHPASVFAH